MFSFTRSRSRLRIKNSRSRSCPKTGRLRNPGLLRQWRQENDYLPSYREYSTRGLIKPFLNPSQPATHTHTHLSTWRSGEDWVRGGGQVASRPPGHAPFKKLRMDTVDSTAGYIQPEISAKSSAIFSMVRSCANEKF